jgi:3-methyladenine DNA glycosylase Tag
MTLLKLVREKRKLNNMISKGASMTRVQRQSEKVDELIVKYYREGGQA